MAPPNAEDLISLRVNDDVAIAGGQEYEDHIRHTIKIMGSFSDKDLAGAANLGLLNTLDPVLDSLPYAFALQASVKQSASGRQLAIELHPGNPLWQKLVAFLTQANPVEMRYVGHIWSLLLEVLLGSISYPGTDSVPSAAAITAAVAAMLHLDPKSSTLTTNHSAIARIALSCNASSNVLALLDKDASHIASKTPANPDHELRSDLTCPSSYYMSRDSGFTQKMTLAQAQEYFILAATNYMAVQNWGRAAVCLERVLVAPCSNNPNGIMIEAYKKWVLLSLLTTGKSQALPRAVNDKTVKTMRGAAKPYESIADAFVRADFGRLLAEVDEGTSIWTEDNNIGLVQRVVADHQRRAVSGLSRTYAALPLEQAAGLINMDQQQASQYLGRLIQAGALNARLAQALGGSLVLSFVNDGAAGALDKPEIELRAELEEQTRRVRALEQDMRDADFALSMTKPYLDSVRRAKSRKQDAGLGGEEHHEMFNAGGMESEDEDVMAEA